MAVRVCPGLLASLGFGGKLVLLSILGVQYVQGVSIYGMSNSCSGDVIKHIKYIIVFVKHLIVDRIRNPQSQIYQLYIYIITN